MGVQYLSHLLAYCARCYGQLLGEWHRLLMTAAVSYPTYRGEARASCDSFSDHTDPGNLFSLQSAITTEKPESPSPLGRAINSREPGSHTGSEVEKLLRPYHKYPTHLGISIVYAQNVSIVETLITFTLHSCCFGLQSVH